MPQQQLSISTRGRGMTDITREVNRVVNASGVKVGVCTLFIRHTSASLIIQENADPAVQRDLESFLTRLVPDGDPIFTHTAEGPDDMSAHVRGVLTATSLSVPVTGGELSLGTWQAIYLWEHRKIAHRREVIVHVAGD